MQCTNEAIGKLQSPNEVLLGQHEAGNMTVDGNRKAARAIATTLQRSFEFDNSPVPFGHPS